jgi:hypothetical protein
MNRGHVGADTLSSCAAAEPMAPGRAIDQNVLPSRSSIGRTSVKCPVPMV